MLHQEKKCFNNSDFTCPDCGRDSEHDGVCDAGNGFCEDCAPEH